MKVDRTPFTVFDFVGYFIPGFIFLYILYLMLCIEFRDILFLIKDSQSIGNQAQSYEYIVFTVFILLFSWFIGHLLSFSSHIFQGCAYKIIDEKGMPICDLFNQGKRKIFKQEEYDNLIGEIFKTLLKRIKGDTEQTEGNSIENYIGDKRLFLKGISGYINTEKYKIVYNYLVIQGAFRALSLIFLINFIIVILSKCTCMEFIFEQWVIKHSNWILLLDAIFFYLCWSIYIKFFRRQIEESTMLLLYEIYLDNKIEDQK
jgi:hypothetical protein